MCRTWDFDNQKTTTWSAAQGSIITAEATATYDATSTFLACEESGKWHLYLQTGTDVPVGETCAETQLFMQKLAPIVPP